MIDRTAAQGLAIKQIAGWTLPGGDVWILVDDLTREEDFGWVFFYTSKRFKDTGDPHAAPVGNAPIIVDRADGSVHLTGTARPISYYIEQYRRDRGGATKDQAPPAG